MSSITLPSSTYPTLSVITPHYFSSYLSSFLTVYCHKCRDYWLLCRSCCSYIKYVTKILLCLELITKIFSTIIFACIVIRAVLLSRIVFLWRESYLCLLNSHKYSRRCSTFSISSTMSIVFYVGGFSPIRLNIINTVSITQVDLYSNQYVSHRSFFICFLTTFADAKIRLIYKLTQSKPCTFSSFLCKRKTLAYIISTKISSILTAISHHPAIIASESFL